MLLGNIGLVEQEQRRGVVDSERIDKGLVDDKRVNDAQFELASCFNEGSSQP